MQSIDSLDKDFQLQKNNCFFPTKISDFVFQSVEQCMKVKVAQLCPTLCAPQTNYTVWNSPGQNTEAGSLSLLQGIFPIQGSNPGLPHCRWILYSWTKYWYIYIYNWPHLHVLRQYGLLCHQFLKGKPDSWPVHMWLCCPHVTDIMNCKKGEFFFFFFS